jgi:lipopolysaccharide/colanic/teichoic acid biosynthesis glycosyltransferase
MTDKKDEKGNLLSDSERLTKFGKTLRSTSIDELPELINILKGDMSFVGPRPLLVKDMVFMTDEQRKRHSVKPGLTGLAQVNGRNDILWEEKLNFDLEYLKKESLLFDLELILQTIWKVLAREGISEKNCDTAEDFGDYLLRMGIVDNQTFCKKQNESKFLLSDSGVR